MISKRVEKRKDGKSSAADALRYGEGLAQGRVRETGEILDKSHRTRLGNFGLVDDGVYIGRDVAAMAELIKLAAVEMQANCDRNTRVGADKKLAHFVISYNQEKPTEAVLRDTEDSMLAVLGLAENHFVSFLHSDNGFWHLHLFASRIEKGSPYRGNALWQDQRKRDQICREIELRHELSRDNGLHEINEHRQLIKVPLAERKARREANQKITDRAKTVEKHSGEKSFQTWCNEIRIGDRLQHAISWPDLHAAAAAYSCEIKPKGAGFVICPLGERGGLALSGVGLKNLLAKFGAFEPAQPSQTIEVTAAYIPEPTKPSGSLYYAWQTARSEFQVTKADTLNLLRNTHVNARADLRKHQQVELAEIRSTTSGQDRTVAVSVAKLSHALALTELAAQHTTERQQVRRQLAQRAPGANFRDYLVKQAAAGNDAALEKAREYGAAETTDVLRQREAERLKVEAAVAGFYNRPSPRLNFAHHIERNGSVVFDLGCGRHVIDSALSKQIQLNNAAAHDAAAVETSLRFAASKFGNKLTLSGPAEFQKLAVETAVRKGLGITFIDPALEAYREKLVTERRTPKFIQPVQARERKHEPPKSNYRSQQPRQIPPPHRRDRLHYLSDGDVVLNTQRNVLPLQQDVPSCVEQPRYEEPNHRVQRSATSAGSGRTVIDKSHAELVAATKKRGSKVLELKDGVPYIGPIQLSADGLFAIQSQGRGAVAIHDLAKLEGHYVNGQNAHIIYHDGVGKSQDTERERTGRNASPER